MADQVGDAAGAGFSALAAAYRPSVNITAAPPWGVPLPFVVGGWLALAAAGLRVWMQRGVLAAGHLASGSVVLTVHLVTLGAITLTMIGLLYQWMPVVFDVPAVPSRWAAMQGAGYALGLGAFLVGWSADRFGWLAAGGTLMALALTAFALMQASRLVRSRRPGGDLAVGVALALVGLTATWALGGTMLVVGPGGRLGAHIATAWVGWVATLVATVQEKLVPMFTMARSPRRPPLILILAGFWVGLGVIWLRPWLPAPEPIKWVAAACWAAAAAIALVRVEAWRCVGRAPWRDSVIWSARLGWGLGLGAALLAPWDPAGAVGLALFAALTFMFGYQSRIAPFIVALAISRRRPGPPQRAFWMARAMGSPVAPTVAALALPLAAITLTAGLWWHRPIWVGSAGLGLTAAVAAHGWLVVGRLARKRQPPPAAAPGGSGTSLGGTD